MGKHRRHVHRWTKAWTRGFDFIGFRCRCGETIERKVTQEDRKRLRAEHREMLREIREMHRTWHSFQRRFMEGLKFKENFDGLERWLKRHPEVVEVSCDDEAHCGSDLLLIPHRCPTQYMGVSVVYLPGCSGEKAQFFLYPSHLRELQKALKLVAKKRGERSRFGS